MGSRGQSKQRGIKTEAYSDFIKLGDGTIIEYDGELQYSKDTGSNRIAVGKLAEFETKRVKGKIEWAQSVLEDGTVLPEVKGSRGSVISPPIYKSDGATFSHIHPRGKGEEGCLGGTFSKRDLLNFSKRPDASYYQRISGARTYRAVAREGTYSITKTNDFNPEKFSQFVMQSHDKNRKIYKSRNKQLDADYRSGKITYQEYVKQYGKSFNTFLVSIHKDLLDNQKQYGYTYGLERS